MIADPRQHLKVATDDTRCRNCASWIEDDHLAGTGDCKKVRWMIGENQQATAPDQTCAKYERSFGRSVGEHEAMALRMGLG